MNPGELERNLRHLADLATRCRELGEQIGGRLGQARDALAASDPPVAAPNHPGPEPKADVEVAIK